MYPVIIELVTRDHAPNYTIPTEQCTLDTCSISQGQVTYDPNLGANLFFLIVFSLLLLLQIILGVYYRTWTYAIGLVGGMALELCGYIGRVKMHYNPFIESPFFMYLISLTIGPTFISASIYICFSRLINTYGSALSPISPRKIVVLFIISDFISLCLQAGGGACSVIADSYSFEEFGIHLMLAGLCLQVFSLALVLLLGAAFAYNCRRKPYSWNQSDYCLAVRRRRYFSGFIQALVVSTVTILIRSTYRVVELTGGFHGKLWNSETYFMVFDGAMVTIASILLTIFHPGMAFHGHWSYVKRG
ncbi:putative RTA1 domain protein [Xylogone sp. PMI_703]|nr:putative RTA1 domain protein [Xylogone sp. PMI_703]